MKIFSKDLQYEERKGLPSEYQEVEWIGSTGTQYINTNLLMSSSMTFYIEFLINSAPNTWHTIFGERTNNGSVSFLIGYSTNHSYYQFNGFNQSRSVYSFYQLNTKHTLYSEIKTVSGSKKLVMNINGNEYQHNYTTTWTSAFPLCIFALSHSGSIIEYGSIQIYKFQIYDGDNVINDFIPCYRKSDGEIGLYDIEGRVFYTNDGTGTFNKGGDVQ